MKKRLNRKKFAKLLDKVITANVGQYEPVHVVWEDACNVASAWTLLDEVQSEGNKARLIHTCGWLLEDKKRHILVGLSIDMQALNWDMVLRIPRASIERIHKLGKVKL